MTDMQEQFSKLAESTFRIALRVASLVALFGIRLVACAVQYLLWCFSHLVAGKRTFSSLVSKVKAKVQDYDQQRYAESLPSPPVTPYPRLFRISWATSKGGEIGEGEHNVHVLLTRSLIRQRLTGTPQAHHHHLAQALASAPVILPNRPHLDWIDSRSKHITRQGSLQTRSQE
jgi:hypothetical protein